MLRRLKSASFCSASARRCSCWRICFSRKSCADWKPELFFFSVFSMKLSSTTCTTLHCAGTIGIAVGDLEIAVALVLD